MRDYVYQRPLVLGLVLCAATLVVLLAGMLAGSNGLDDWHGLGALLGLAQADADGGMMAQIVWQIPCRAASAHGLQVLYLVWPVRFRKRFFAIPWPTLICWVAPLAHRWVFAWPWSGSMDRSSICTGWPGWA